MRKKDNPLIDDLTDNQRHVLNLLISENTALSAYTILDRLRTKGFRAPLQVYRALEKLIELSLVHRLESLNAFIACSHPQYEEHNLVAFIICRKCRNIIEFEDGIIADNVKERMQIIHFQAQDTTLEIKGICAKCQN
ncbi:MAG: zinc uptake regulator [Candidatus Tokpelaia sp. JSC188]|nr:MAG: zinc uptake regulator [Candidatus Tokpelaia sp. JSC188]